MWRLAVHGICKDPLRTALVAGALAVPVALQICLASLGAGYERSLRAELDRTGLHLMVVPIGCPYDAAARVIKGQALDSTLPEAALEAVRADPAVAVAAPVLTIAIPRASEKRTDLWVGLDAQALAMKPWWKMKAGRDWFERPDGVILGAEAAAIETRAPGDSFYCPEAQRKLVVEGVLAPSGTTDDHLFFVPLAQAQEMFRQQGRLTAITVRLRQPELLRAASERLQQIPGVQVATATEMLGVFLNLVGSVRLLLQCIAWLALTVCVLGVFNTMLGAVLNRTGELAVLRAVGASRPQVFLLVTAEAVLLSGAAGLAGGLLSFLLLHQAGPALQSWLPMAPATFAGQLDGAATVSTILACLLAGLIAAAYPAWRASQIRPAIALKEDALP